MTLILDWPPEVIARLTAEARQAGLTLDEFLLRSVQGQGGTAVAPPADEDAQRKRREEAGRRILDLRKGNILGPDLTIRDLIEEGRRY